MAINIHANVLFKVECAAHGQTHVWNNVDVCFARIDQLKLRDAVVKARNQIKTLPTKIVSENICLDTFQGRESLLGFLLCQRDHIWREIDDSNLRAPCF